MRPQARGHTLIGLIIALAIFAALIDAGLSSSRRHAAAAADADVAELGRALDEARHQALLRRRGVTICAADAGGRCDARRPRRLRVFLADGGGELRGATLRQPHAWIEIKGVFGRARLGFDARGAAARAGSIRYCPGERRSATLRRRLILGPGGAWREAEDRKRDSAEDVCAP